MKLCRRLREILLLGIFLLSFCQENMVSGSILSSNKVVMNEVVVFHVHGHDSSEILLGYHTRTPEGKFVVLLPKKPYGKQLGESHTQAVRCWNVLSLTSNSSKTLTQLFKNNLISIMRSLFFHKI